MASVPCENPGAFAAALVPYAAGFGLRRGDVLVVLRYRLDTVGDLECTDELRRREYRPDVLRSRTGSRRLISVPDLGVDDRRSFLLGGFPQALDDTLGDLVTSSGWTLRQVQRQIAYYSQL